MSGEQNKNLPTLRGSDKQIGYATRLRREKIDHLNDLIKTTIVYKSGAYLYTEEKMIEMAKEKYSDRELDILLKEINIYMNLAKELNMVETEESAAWFIEEYKG